MPNPKEIKPIADLLVLGLIILGVSEGSVIAKTGCTTNPAGNGASKDCAKSETFAIVCSWAAQKTISCHDSIAALLSITTTEEKILSVVQFSRVKCPPTWPCLPISHTSVWFVYNSAHPSLGVRSHPPLSSPPARLNS